MTFIVYSDIINKHRYKYSIHGYLYRLFLKGKHMEIKILKLITGEEVLGEVEIESETEVVLVNPVGVAIVRGKDGQPNVGFAPFPMHADQKTGESIAFAKRNVIYSYVPAKEFVDNYNQIFGSGIVLPNKQLIVG